MRNLIFTFTALALTAAAQVRAQDVIAKTPHLSPADEHKTFKLPPGFEIQLVAAEPQINKPMNLAFDAKGRLWVTSTTDYPYPAEEGKGNDKVFVLSDFADDGHAQKVETFAEGLTIPIGLLPIEKGVLVYDVGHIRRFLDTNNNGKADKVEPFLSTYGHRDTHGMTNHFTVGFDGWVYADHGFNNDSELRASDGSTIKLNSGNTYRFKLDGSHIEQWTHGQVNPFGLCFDPRGDLWSADCHSRPQYMLLRGAYYPSFGKPDDGLGFAPEMCTHDHGSTAISGTIYYAATQFPPEYRGTLFNGNVVTNKINRDTLEWHGSSPRAVEAPDFLSSSDPWFRPVDIVIGPDGAMYVADFYNRIIGHYEVPLDHPGRDRTSGRIWRIVYRGEDEKGAVPKMPDLTKLDVEGLYRALGDPNFVVQMLAHRRLLEAYDREQQLSWLMRRIKAPVDSDSRRATHVIWAYQQLFGLYEEGLKDYLQASEPIVRLHALRVIAESEMWERRQPQSVERAGLFKAAREMLRDSDPFVRRAAADALGQHPDVQNVRPLLGARKAAPADDTHLIYVLRSALRNQLEDESVIAGLPNLKLNGDEERGLADVITGVSSPVAAPVLLSLLKKGVTDPSKTVALLTTAARGVPLEDVDQLTKIALQRFPQDLDVQRQLLIAMIDGLAQRGAQPGDATRKWGADLAKQLTELPRFDAAAWTFQPLPGSKDQTNPWASQLRGVGTKHPAELWSSHPKGEKLTGILRSKPFTIPAKLSFLIAGHYAGAPPTPGESKNFVRLKLVEGDEKIAEAIPPRNDTPRPVKWDLSKWKGKQGYIEAVDGDDGQAFAWIAFGQFNPEVAPTPGSIERARERFLAASVITRALKLAELRGEMEKVVGDPSADAEARAGAARALGTVGTPESVKALAAIATDPNAAPALRDAVAQALSEQNSPQARESLLAAIAVAPEPLQRSLAVALAANHDGAEPLLAAIAAGKASPRMLQDAVLVERLKAAGAADVDTRVKDLTKGLVSADEAVRKLIEQRRAAFDPSKASTARGAEVFTKNCAACHRIGNVGAIIGPQLDGVGKRGTDRIMEDVLDPNRNVDGAFRTVTIQLKTGETVSGLLRREEGQLVVLADSTGKETTVDKTKEKRRVPSQLSLMPSNFGETLKPEEFNDLVAFLLSK